MLTGKYVSSFISSEVCYRSSTLPKFLVLIAFVVAYFFFLLSIMYIPAKIPSGMPKNGVVMALTRIIEITNTVML